MKLISLMYHDVVEAGEWNASGFTGTDAALYKLDRASFAKHLEAIEHVLTVQPVGIDELDFARTDIRGRSGVLLTFDDGGASALRIADELDKRAWRGHFFVTSGLIGSQSFLTASQVRELHERGHVIGSHSHSHPTRMSLLDWEAKLNEWDRSVKILSDIVGTPIRFASVPGGHFSREVAETASIAGIEALFTSEPTTRIARVKGCRVLGRYAIQRWTTPIRAAAIASGRVAPRVRQLVFWNTKKAMKTVGGEQYLKFRESLVRQLAAQQVEASSTKLKERG